MVSPPSPTASPTESRLRSSGSFAKKTILKKRSMSEVMLQKSLSTSSLLKQAAAAIESQQSGLSRPAMVSRANSDFSTFLHGSKSTSAINTRELPSALSTGSQSPLYAKHIHFNDQVQQCIAVDKDEEDDDDEDEVFQQESIEDSSSDDDGLLMMPKAKGCSKVGSRGCPGDHQTIAMLPSTTLKAVEEVVEVKKNDTFSNFGSFFSSFGAGASSTEAKEPEKTQSLMGTKSYILEEDDDDMAELDWEPSRFATRRDSVSVTQDRFGSRSFESRPNPKEDDFQLPNYTYNEDEDDEVAAGLFGRAVDAVNTARDIAHVLWNVGWSR